MKKNYLKYKNELRGKYKKKFDEAEAYCILLLENVDKATKNEIMLDMLCTFISAQDEKIPVENIIGGNMQQFCEECCSNLPIKYKLRYILELFKYWAYVILIFDGLEIALNFKFDNLLEITSNLGGFIASIFLCILISFIYKIISKKTMIDDIKQNNKIKISSVIKNSIYILLTTIIVVLCATTIIINIPTIIMIVVALSYLVIYRIIYSNDSKSKVDQAKLTVVEDLKSSKETLYNLNKAQKRKGKNKITEEEYINIRTNEATKELKHNKLNLIVPVIFSLISTIVIVINGSLVDAVLLFLLISIVEYMIFIPLYKFNKKYNNLLIKKYNYLKKHSIPIEDWK